MSLCKDREEIRLERVDAEGGWIERPVKSWLGMGCPGDRPS